MKKLAMALSFIYPALTGSNLCALPKYKTPEQIYKEAPAICIIFSGMEIKGKNLKSEQKTVTLEGGIGTCFLAEFEGKIRLITAAHVVSADKSELLNNINSQIMGSAPKDPRGLWVAISEVKLVAYAVFQDTVPSLKNVKEEFQLPKSTAMYKNSGVLEVAAEKIDNNLDLAALKLKDASAYKNLRVGKLGDSDRLEIGERVYAIGHPEGHQFAFLSGEIAHFHFGKMYGKPANSHIITSEMMGFGSSGGPLLNRQGEIVGLGVMKEFREPHFSVFIPSNQIKKFLKSR